MDGSDESLHPPVDAFTASSVSHVGLSGTTEIMTDKGPLPLASAGVLGCKINVWNGAAFVLAQPRPVAAPVTQVQIITSDGCKIRCDENLLVPIELRGCDNAAMMATRSRTLHIIGENSGVRAVPAGLLTIGTKLHRSLCPTYEGKPGVFSTAFLSGAVYGYGMVNYTGPRGVDTATFEVPWMRFPLKLKRAIPDPTNPEIKTFEDVDNPHLAELGYNREAAIDFTRKNGLEFDHKEDALIIVPQAMQRAATIPNAPHQQRMAWAAGFGYATSRYATAAGPRGNIAAAIAMINSTGPKFEVKAVCTDSDTNTWALRRIPVPPEDVEARAQLCPTVWAISRLSGTSAVYTVDGTDTVMANGVVVGTNSLNPPAPPPAPASTTTSTSTVDQ